MSEDFEKKVEEAIRNPQNMGELSDADSVGTVGNADCGDMLRVWVKYKDEDGRKVIDKATFQTFGCETAIAAASLAMDLIRGKTREQALDSVGHEFTNVLGPLPPAKVHCTQLVEGALRSALEPTNSDAPKVASPNPAPSSSGNLDESLGQSQKHGVRVVLLPKES